VVIDLVTAGIDVGRAEIAVAAGQGHVGIDAVFQPGARLIGEGGVAARGPGGQAGDRVNRDIVAGDADTGRQIGADIMPIKAEIVVGIQHQQPGLDVAARPNAVAIGEIDMGYAGITIGQLALDPDVLGHAQAQRAREGRSVIEADAAALSAGAFAEVPVVQDIQAQRAGKIQAAGLRQRRNGAEHKQADGNYRGLAKKHAGEPGWREQKRILLHCYDFILTERIPASNGAGSCTAGGY
jgi:hypothetical protein